MKNSTTQSNQKSSEKREHEIRLADKFWRRSTHLSIEAKALYALLLTFADYKTGETFVSNDRLQLESGFGRDRVEHLLSELELGGLIKRRRQYRKNLLAKRWIRCLKYVISDTLGFRASSRYPGFQGTENQGTILTSVKSSVTPEKQEEPSFPRTQQIPERIM